MQDWQSQTALVPGFIKSHQTRSRRAIIADRHAAVALPQGSKDRAPNQLVA